MGCFDLTEREREVAIAAAKGLTRTAIAEQCGLTTNTVSQYLHRAYAKLGITGTYACRDLIANRAELFPQEFNAPSFVQATPPPPPPPPRRTWVEEFKAMEEMSIPDRREHFRVLAQGRPLPPTFNAWSVAMRLEWLNKEWPL